MRKLNSIWFIAATMLLLAGCKTKPDAGFGEVQTTVHDRLGQTVMYPLTRTDSEKADAAVAQLLQTNLSANSAVQIALLNNRSLRATLEEIGISQADLLQAGLPPNPRFFGYVPIDGPPSAPNTTFSLSEDFLNALLLPLKKKIAAQQFQETRLRITESIFQLAADVKVAFYTVQGRQQLLKRLENIRDLNAAAADLSTRQYDAGNINDLELADQQAVFQSARLEFDRAQAQLHLDRDRLNRLLGLWGTNAAWTINDELPAIPTPDISLDNLESLALQQRLDLAAAQQHVNLLRRALSLRSGTRYLPTTIDVGVETDRESRTQNLVGPSLDLDLPLFDHGQAAVPRLEAQVRQAQWRMEALAADIRSEVHQAYDSLTASRDIAQFYRETYLPQRSRILNQTLLQYNAMQLGAFELMNVRKSELDAEREYIESWRDYWIARTELERAVGGNLLVGTTQPKPSN